MTSKNKHLLLISDAPERWQTALNFNGVKLSIARTAAEAAQACRRPHDLAVVAVAAEALTDVLATLRAGVAQQQMPVLVENSNAIQTPALAGVLPAYRAMPCGFDDLLKLARRRLAVA
jgi:hypothetical protein